MCSAQWEIRRGRCCTYAYERMSAITNALVISEYVLTEFHRPIHKLNSCVNFGCLKNLMDRKFTHACCCVDVFIVNLPSYATS